MGQRKLFFKRLLAGAMTGVMLAGAVGTQLPASVADAAPASQAVGEISVNPQVHYQTLKGWGTSMCWWGNVIGSWGDKDFNNNGRPDREEIAELAFSPEYLNLNIGRRRQRGFLHQTCGRSCAGLDQGYDRESGRNGHIQCGRFLC